MEEERDGKAVGGHRPLRRRGDRELVLTILILGASAIDMDTRYWGASGWGSGVGFLGVAVGFRNLMRTAAHMQRDIERAEARDPAANRWKVDPGWLHDDREGDHVASGPDPDPRRPGERDKDGG